MASKPFAPSPCTLDAQALFTDGEFSCFQSPNPCLLLFTDGEFPRGLAVEVPGGGGGQGSQGGTGGKSWRRRVEQERLRQLQRIQNEDAIILALLLADDDDDDWF